MKMNNLINSDFKTAEPLNNFFSNIVKNVRTPEYENLKTNFEYVKDPAFKAILKYIYHPSITVIKENKTENLLFIKLAMKKL